MNNSQPDSISKSNNSPNLPQKKAITGSWWRKLGKKWNNLSIRTKISLLLITGATIPVIAVTQGIVEFAKKESLNALRDELATKLAILEEEIFLEKRNLLANANALALAVQAATINPSDTGEVTANERKLQSLITDVREQQPNASFYLITDARGNTVTQFIQTINHDSEYPLVPDSDEQTHDTSNHQELDTTQFQPVDLKTGIALGDLPIVNKALELSRPLSGFEIVPSEIIDRLGLGDQTNIGLRFQQTEGLPELKKPYPEGKFDIDDGKAGFVLMAVKPIKLDNNEVGTAIIGTLVNRNFELVDHLKEVANVSTATIFAQDWRVSTNVPYTDKTTRAIGTRVSKAVADVVLNRGEVYLGNANIIGIEYETGYSPIYNHLEQIDPEQAQPVGIAYVGEPQTEVALTLRRITLAGYGIGGVVLIVVTTVLILAPSDKSISRPLRELTKFASQIGEGNSKIRLKSSDRQDEIGILSQNLNEMATTIDASLEAKQIEAQTQRQEKEQLELAIYTLIDEIADATNGDLTVRANLDSLELSTVADLFNAIIDNLQDIAIEAKQSSSLVGSSLKQNEEAIRILAERASIEAKETRDTLKSVALMSQSIQTVATNANQAEKIADDTYNTVLNSTNNMNSTVDSILNLRTTVSDTADKMQRLAESSQKISQAVTLIEEIALKTNVLAINAGAEADRAGEYGQGFSVVAEQVGALAEQSKTAIKEIAGVVSRIQTETQDVRQAMESGTAQVLNTTRLVENTKQNLAEVLEKSQTINQLMESISQSTVSQADTSQNVTSLMQKIAKLSATTSKSSTEVAQSMVETAREVEKLESAVSQFKVAEH